MGKDIAYVRLFDKMLPLRPIVIEFNNNKCCLEIHNSSDSTVKFLFGNEIAYFNVRSKGLVQANNSNHFPINQYLHDRITPATLSSKPLAYDKPKFLTHLKCLGYRHVLTQSQTILMSLPKMTITHG